MFDRIIGVSVLIFWLLTVIFYPMLVSMYVTLPLFVGFAGLMFIIGIDEDRYLYILFSLIYMFNMELNLSLPLLLMTISTIIFYIFIKPKLQFIKICKRCVYIVTVLSINLIYFLLLSGYDFINSQSSINYDSLIIYSLVYDVIAAVLI